MTSRLIFLLAAGLAGCSSDRGDNRDLHPSDFDPADAAADMYESDTSQSDLSPRPAGELVVLPLAVQLADLGTAELSIVLDVEPASDVTVSFESSDPAALRVPAPLTFTSDNWDVPQAALLRGVADDCPDGTKSVTVTVHAEGSDNYANVPSVSVAADVIETTDPGFSVTPTEITVFEGQAGQIFTVRTGSSCAFGDVTIPIVVSDPTQLESSVTELTFTPENIASPQLVTVNAIDDADIEPDQAYAIFVGPAIGGGFDGLSLDDVAVTVVDNDIPSLTVNPQMVSTTESGGSAVFEVALDATPAVPVVVEAMVGDPTEGAIAPRSLTFGPSNVGPDTFTITGLDDPDCDGDQIYQITFVVSSTDPFFDGLVVPAVMVRNFDSDSCTATVIPQALNVTEGESDSFTVVLSSGDPGEVVTVDFTSSDPNEAVVTPPSITFNGGNFGTPQTITVTALSNAIVDGDRTVIIDTVLNATLAYAGVDPANVTVSISDDD